jgi:subtilisin family serine protease
MKNKLFVIAFAIVASAAGLLIHPTRSGAQEPKFRHTENAIPNQYIVVLKPETTSSLISSTTQSLAATYGGQVGFVYEHALKGFSIQMNEAAAIALSNNPLVDYVAEDGEVSISGTQLNPSSWGLDRIDQRDLSVNNAYTYNVTGAGVHAYVIDTGIRPTHQDFHGRASIAADFVGDGQGGNDCHGHGTHVAGTVGGTSYGVAKGVTIHAVRVIGCGGTGQLSGVIAGINWVTANRASPAVVNLSVNAVGVSQPLDTAVTNSINSGVTYVIAAGNNGVDAINTSPARVSAAITVGATDMSDIRSVFTQFSSSNYGAVLDLFAPGSFITSAWWDSDTSQQTIGGTSMAAPHVAGVVAQYLQVHPGASPGEVRNAIVNNATVGRVINPGPGSPNRLLFSHFLPQPPPVTTTDFDGDLKADIAVSRPGTYIIWYIIESLTGAVRYGSWGGSEFNDVLVPADYDGDGKADLAVWRPDGGGWYIMESSTGTVRYKSWGWGVGSYNDVPVPADYDGDGKADIAVWRPDGGGWYIIQSSTGTERYVSWGMPGDVPIPSVYNRR